MSSPTRVIRRDIADNYYSRSSTPINNLISKIFDPTQPKSQPSQQQQQQQLQQQQQYHQQQRKTDDLQSSPLMRVRKITAKTLPSSESYDSQTLTQLNTSNSFVSSSIPQRTKESRTSGGNSSPIFVRSMKAKTQNNISISHVNLPRISGNSSSRIIGLKSSASAKEVTGKFLLPKTFGQQKSKEQKNLLNAAAAAAASSSPTTKKLFHQAVSPSFFQIQRDAPLKKYEKIAPIASLYNNARLMASIDIKEVSPIYPRYYHKTRKHDVDVFCGKIAAYSLIDSIDMDKKQKIKELTRAQKLSKLNQDECY